MDNAIYSLKLLIVMLISIILTTYNHKIFIKDTIESVLKQSFSDRELLIWDDSPNDETWNIIENYTSTYDNIHAWHHNPNKWIVENMNFLINKMNKKSEYIVFLEWDDILATNYVNDKLKIFNKYPEVNLVYNNIDFINSEWNIIQKDIFNFRNIKTYKNQKINCNAFVNSNVWPIISRSTIMVKREILTKYPIMSSSWNKNCAISDYDFCFRVSTENKVYYVNSPLTLYRRHSSNLSAWNINLLEDLSNLIMKYYDEWKISKKTLQYKLSQNNIMIALMLLEKWDKKKCFKYFKQSLHDSMSSNLILKIWTLLLLLLPYKITKTILSKFIKRN